jgi:hypothetical protein
VQLTKGVTIRVDMRVVRRGSFSMLGPHFVPPQLISPSNTPPPPPPLPPTNALKLVAGCIIHTVPTTESQRIPLELCVFVCVGVCVCVCVRTAQHSRMYWASWRRGSVGERASTLEYGTSVLHFVGGDQVKC